MIIDTNCICERLSRNPVGKRVNFELFVKNKGPIIDYNLKNIKDYPTSHFYFRYIEKEDSQWALPYLGNFMDFGFYKQLSPFWKSRSDDSTTFFEVCRSLPFLKAIYEDSEKIELPFSLRGNMLFDRTNITGREETKDHLVDLSGRVVGASSLRLKKRDIKLDLIVGANFFNDNDSCFITTACTRNLGLPDNCLELTTLRGLRDNYLLCSKEGGRMVKEYYEISPKIVKSILKNPESKEIFRETTEDIQRAVRLTLNGNRNNATKHYEKMVGRLKSI